MEPHQTLNAFLPKLRAALVHNGSRIKRLHLPATLCGWELSNKLSRRQRSIGKPGLSAPQSKES
jgi:hypothetical protein